MDIATGPLGTLLPKLTKLLQDEYNLQKGARKGIEFLYKELEIMHAALDKIGVVPIEQADRLQRIWARDVKELSYDMEDIVDTFMVKVEGPDPPSKRGAKKIFSKMIRKVTKAMTRREVAQDIKDIKERAMELAERHARFKVDDIAPAKKIPVDPRLLKALYTEATEIVGIEDAKKEVITMLTEGDIISLQKRIVSITGFGGLGKTTLAKAVYDEIKEQFDCTAFVSVSRNPDAEELLKDMLYQLKGDRAKLVKINHLVDLVREFLMNKRYLIVIDDIWAKKPWDEVIGHALIENKMRSRIITTTRIIDVALHVGGCYTLKPLSDESSDMLFYGRIFGSKDNCPTQFSEVSIKILKKCAGVPLAIVTTSSLLANKSENIKEWYDVCDSIGGGLGINPGMDSMRKIQLLSYYDLPSHLKTCLLYLSIFPEDYEISKDRLIRRWVAEGFVQEKKGHQSFLETGESYFNELLNTSLIQPAGKYDAEGTPEACRVHDTVLDLIVSLSVEECFITTVLGDGMESKVRWLSLHGNSTWPTMNMPKLRSLTIFTLFKPVVTDLVLSSYHLLRVLDLQDYEFKDDDRASIGTLGNLSHLRYICLPSGNRMYESIKVLPVEIGKLRFLQTLDLSQTKVNQLPSSVLTCLGQLICLRGAIWYGGTDLPDGLKKLTSLEVLERVTVTSKSIAEELGHLTQLRVLDVRVRICPTVPNKLISYSQLDVDVDDYWRVCTKALVESLGKLKKLESVYIRNNGIRANFAGSSVEEPLGNLRRLGIDSAPMLPTWIKSATFPVLSDLDICVCYYERRDIQVLGTLPCLRRLKFRVISERIYYELDEEITLKRCVVGPNAFPCAVECKFDVAGRRGVVPSMFPRGAMPRLQDFTFRIGAEQFGSGGGSSVDDLGLAHLPSLRSVTVRVDILGYFNDEAIIRDKVVPRSVREKLEHEAAVHPNHPLRIRWKQVS